MSKQKLLYLIIFLEGYAVLATELLAVRGLVPFVGSGVEVVSIIIGAVLMPLAIGYYVGGRRMRKEFAHVRANGLRCISPRRILQNNLLIALMVLMLGLSYNAQILFFEALRISGVENRIILTALYSVTFLVTPTYLLAQTVPLVSHYFSKARLSEITGRMLFFSTLGSFFGSIVSTLVLMTMIGVHYTVVVTLEIIVCLILIITPRGGRFTSSLALLFGFVSWMINSDSAMEQMHVIADTPYSLISRFVSLEQDGIILSINHSGSSKYAADPKNRFPYVRYVEEHFINPIMDAKEPKKILLLGAGGFTTGWDDRKNDYTFVDIDPALQKVAEEYFLPEKLPPNKRFVATSARAFLNNQQEKYDLVFIDLYSNLFSIPMESITREFLQKVKLVLKPGGVVIANIISDASYSNRFTVRYYNTFASVFPMFDRHVIGEYNGWGGNKNNNNTLYIYYNSPGVDDRTVYTDDKNTHSFDH